MAASSSLKRSNDKISQVLSRSSQALFSSPIMLSSVKHSQQIKPYKKEVFITTKPKQIVPIEQAVKQQCLKEVFITSKPKKSPSSFDQQSDQLIAQVRKGEFTISKPRITEEKSEQRLTMRIQRKVDCSTSDDFDAIKNRCPTPGIQGSERTINSSLSPAKPEEPYVEIVEQALILKNSGNEIVGASSTQLSKSFPSIRVRNCPPAEAVVVVSCVDAKPNFRTHPHRLHWDEGHSEKGVVSATFLSSEKLDLRGIFLQPTIKNAVRTAMEERQTIRVDPFRQGFDHQDSEIDLSSVRICYQVFIKLRDGALLPLRPITSSPLKVDRRKKTFEIVQLSDQSIPAHGNALLTLTCCNIDPRDDFDVRLEQKYEDSNNTSNAWSHIVKSAEVNVDGPCISFIAPAFRDGIIKEEVTVRLYLIRTSDKKFSKPVQLCYSPSLHTTNTIINSKGSRPTEAANSDDDDSSTQLPKVGTSYSLVNMPSDDDTTQDSPLQDPLHRTNSTDPRHTLYQSKELTAERDANRYLTQRCSTLQKQQGELMQIKVILQQDLDEFRAENEGLKASNASLAELNLELEQEVAQWKQGAGKERMIQHLQAEGKELRTKVEMLNATVLELRTNLKDQNRGVENMRWQLQQRDLQVKALEKRLEETFPMSDASSAIIRGERDSSPSVTSSEQEKVVREGEEDGGSKKRRRLSSDD